MGDQTPENRAPATSAKGDADSSARPRELEDWLNFHLYHPLSMRLAKALVPTRITPDMVSIVGGAMIVLAAVAYSMVAGLPGVLIGLGLHMSWHVLDGADGDLARLTARSSSRGEVIDGICDYAGHIVLYVTLGMMLAEDIGSAAWWFMWGAGLGRIVQAAHYEVQRRQYQYWVYGRTWLRVAAHRVDRPKGIIGGLASGYVSLAKLLAPGARKVDALVDAADEHDVARLRGLIRREMAQVIRWTSPLSANYRTIALGASMLAGTPLYFFVFEAFLLTGMLLVSIAIAGSATKRIIAHAEPMSSL